jgi:NAD(P)H-hydrate epimerase
LKKIPKNSILTPHPKEFERLFGETKNDFERLKLAEQKAKELDVIIVLKGHHTCIATPAEKSISIIPAMQAWQKVAAVMY